MNFHVLTLFPEMIENGLNTSILGRAAAKGLLSFEAVNIRDYTLERHGQVDDYPYGGGAGMVMQAEPIYRAVSSLAERIGKKPRVIYLTPQGRVFNQKIAEEFAGEEDLVFLCGHYEGVDERALELVATDYVSAGDYVLTGGELPAMMMIDCIARLVPGVLNNNVSAEFESFHDNLLEYPQYTRPEEFMGLRVPEILLSGHHANIEKWRREQSILRTLERRPELLKDAALSKKEREFLKKAMEEKKRREEEEKTKMKPFPELPYERPDMEAVIGEVRAVLEELKTAVSYPEFKRSYLRYVDIDTDLTTRRQIAHIRNTINLLDPFYEAEMAYFNAWMPKYDLAVKEMGAVILSSPFRREMELEFGEILIENMEAAQLLSSGEVVEDLAREADLSALYSKTVAGATAEFQGETVNTYGLLKHMQSTDRTERKAAFEAWAGLYEEIAPKIDSIYDELVHLRAGMAKKLGFENFIPMGYLKRRRYDYTAKELEVFRRQVREVIVPACERLYERQREALGIEKLCYYDEPIASLEGNPAPVGTTKELVEKAQKMYRELSPESGEFFDFMVRYELFDLEAKKGKRVGGYCTSLPSYHAPFIFSNFNQTEADINVLTHEAGHAFAGFTAAKFQKLPELCHSTSEINEIHSMSMELWTYPWMELFFGDRASEYRIGHLADALKKIPYMVCVDEYQHRVYGNPDMTAMERRAVWKELSAVYMPWRDYDGNAFMEEGGFWMQKQHIFLYPFYYVDYAIAQIGAFEFYTRQKEDRAAAWADYCRLCKAGGSMGYFKLLEYAGLRNLLEDGAVEDALQGVFEDLDV